MKYTVQKLVASVEEAEDDWPTNNLLEMITWLHGQAQTIPEEFRDNAQCQITTIDRSELSYATLTISYSRPETDEEIERRLAQEAGLEERSRKRELAELDRLMVKYGR